MHQQPDEATADGSVDPLAGVRRSLPCSTSVPTPFLTSRASVCPSAQVISSQLRELWDEEIAQRIGAPKAARAVARACACNPLAVAIPCHRVIRQDATISGYRWGVERKRALLAREAEEVPSGCGVGPPACSREAGAG